MARSQRVAIGVLLACGALITAERGHPADAESDKSLSECKIARQNKSCYVAIEDTSTPVPASIRVNSAPGSKVEVRIKRKPFDQLSFDVSTQLQPTPDVAAAVLKQLLDPLKSLVFESHIKFTESTIAPADFDIEKARNPDVEKCPPGDKVLCDEVQDILMQQGQIADELQTWAGYADVAADSAATLKKYKWMDPNGTAVDAALGQDIAALSKTLGSDAVQEPCGRSRRNLSQCKLPASQAAALRQKIAFVQQVIAGQSPVDSPGHRRLLQGLAEAQDKQEKLQASLDSAKQAQEKLAAIADKLNNLKTDDDLKPVAIHAIHSPGGTAQTQVKPTSTNLWNGKATTLPTVTIQWQNQRWYVSAGVMFSTMPKRSFGVAPMLDQNGAPLLDSANAQRKQITRTSTTPAVIPVGLVSFRLGDEGGFGTRRTAWFGTLGLGVNDGSAEGFAGVSFAYGAVIFTAGGHLGRLKKLRQPLKLGMETTISSDDLQNFVDKKWRVRPGIAFSVEVPLG